MTTFATISFAHPGNFSFSTYLSIWNDETLVQHYALPLSDWSSFAASTTIVISSDGQFVCISRLVEPLLSRIYSVANGTYVEVPELKNSNPYGPSFHTVQWSPRGLFVSARGDYAYDPYTNTLIPLPGPSAAAQEDGAGLEFHGYSVLAVEGLLFEAQPLDSLDDPETYPLLVKDLFTGQVLDAPYGVAGFPYAGARPCAWHDDTEVRGCLYRSSNAEFPYPEYPFSPSRVANFMTGFSKHLPAPFNYSMAVGATVNGVVFNKSGAPQITSMSDTGEAGPVIEPPDFFQIASPSRNGRVNFLYKNTLFVGGSAGSLDVGSELPIGISTVGGTPATPPAWILNLSAWGGLQSVQIGAAASPRTFRNPLAQDGEFWTNRKFASETVL